MTVLCTHLKFFDLLLEIPDTILGLFLGFIMSLFVLLACCVQLDLCAHPNSCQLCFMPHTQLMHLLLQVGEVLVNTM